MRPLLFCTWQRCSSQKRTPACIVLRPALNRIVLGGFRYNSLISSDDDLDDYTTTGAWEILSSAQPDNFVNMGGTSTLLVFGNGAGSNTVQILVAATTARIALRVKRATNAWTQWRELQGSFITT